MEYFPDLKDSVTYELFKEPVVISDGFTYDNEPLDTWLATHNTSPMTNATLTNRQSFNNTNLKNVIEQGRHVVKRLKDCESKKPKKKEGFFFFKKPGTKPGPKPDRKPKKKFDLTDNLPQGNWVEY